MAQHLPTSPLDRPAVVPGSRRPEGARGGVDQVRPGDVLLSLGDGPLSWAIATFDGGGVSHAAIALDDGQLGEAVGAGLRTYPITASAADHKRMVSRRLTTPADPTPITDVARRYLDAGGEYAYSQIVLLAVLSTTRRAPVPGSGRRLLRAVLDQAAGVLNTVVEQGRTLMICSEFAYRCHREADPAGPYALDIGGTEPHDESPLHWARGHPALPLAIPTDHNAAVGDLSSPIAEYAAEAGLAMPFTIPLPTNPLTSEPVSDEQLLHSVVGFGTALAKATAIDVADSPHPPLDAIHAYATNPNFVTPGDLARTTSLTDRVHLDS